MPDNPGLGALFTLYLDGEAVARFQDIEGMGARIDAIPYREGGAGSVRHLPGKAKVSPVTLRHGVTVDSRLWDWCTATVTGNISRRTVLVTLSAQDGGSEATRWTFFEAWPSSFRADPLDKQRDEIAFDSLTLVYDRLERD
ncbi:MULTISPECIES: phage tail protein [Mameliella]|uniref:phage tail protein n=1 Tax=Mameliella TaxID=1434019 RepID=UPI000B53440B|nr:MULTISPECIES: phage tail protein [Mameliella]MCR9274335.1 phage tail protein [Paracoccaceae bacterium]OWV54551.1 phage tail protein [Mameliella alba]